MLDEAEPWGLVRCVEASKRYQLAGGLIAECPRGQLGDPKQGPSP